MTSVYRVFAQHGRLLYVGIANRLGVRLRQHEERSDWFAETAFVEISRYATRDAALAAEGKAIDEESPTYNQRASGRAARRRDHGAAEHHRQDIQRRLLNARTRVGPLFDEIALYCDNSACVVREIRLHIKEHDSELTPALRCPSCGQQVKADWVGCVRRERVSEEITDITTFLGAADDFEVLDR